MAKLNEFYDIPCAKRDEMLLDATSECHSWHYARNEAYRATVSVRGVGPDVREEQLSRLLRVSAIIFKGYIEQLGTPFPQDQPRHFLAWLTGQLSFDLPLDRATALLPRYRTLEGLLSAIERLCADRGVEIVTSSGTSGKFTILVRDAASVETATEA